MPQEAINNGTIDETQKCHALPFEEGHGILCCYLRLPLRAADYGKHL